tara:strand:- start:57360 stop:57527 length:168 start_codon:yes stop_codon:yes gene_type:complete
MNKNKHLDLNKHLKLIDDMIKGLEIEIKQFNRESNINKILNEEDEEKEVTEKISK